MATFSWELEVSIELNWALGNEESSRMGVQSLWLFRCFQTPTPIIPDHQLRSQLGKEWPSCVYTARVERRSQQESRLAQKLHKRPREFIGCEQLPRRKLACHEESCEDIGLLGRIKCMAREFSWFWLLSPHHCNLATSTRKHWEGKGRGRIDVNEQAVSWAAGFQFNLFSSLCVSTP